MYGNVQIFYKQDLANRRYQIINVCKKACFQDIGTYSNFYVLKYNETNMPTKSAHRTMKIYPLLRELGGLR